MHNAHSLSAHALDSIEIQQLLCHRHVHFLNNQAIISLPIKLTRGIRVNTSQLIIGDVNKTGEGNKKS